MRTNLAVQVEHGDVYVISGTGYVARFYGDDAEANAEIFITALLNSKRGDDWRAAAGV